MVEATEPVKSVQHIQMHYDSVGQCNIEVSCGQSGLTASVCYFIDADQDSHEYAQVLSELYEAGFEMSDKGTTSTGRRMVKGKTDL